VVLAARAGTVRAKRTLSCIVAAVHHAARRLSGQYILELSTMHRWSPAPAEAVRLIAESTHLCIAGEVITRRCSALKLSSESRVQLHPA
jgi:hypothetical protein